MRTIVEALVITRMMMIHCLVKILLTGLLMLKMKISLLLLIVSIT
jgi:hypothetical protein